MRKTSAMLILIVITLLATLTAAHAGGRRGALSFERVAVRGDVQKFTKKVLSRGFLVEGEALVGTWEGYRGTRVRVTGGADGTVAVVEATVVAPDDWPDIEALYREVTGKMIGHWGMPDKTAFLFDGREGGYVNDTAKMLKLIDGKAEVSSAWNLRDGSVYVTTIFRDGRYLVATRYTPNLFY